MPAASSPAELSQQLLALIETRAQQGLAYARSCPTGGAPQMMERFLAGLDPYVWSFQELAPLAEWLQQQGIPAPAAQLDRIMRDLATARQQWITMYGGMLDTQSGFQTIWAEATQFATANVLAQTAYSNAVFAKWQTGMFDLMESNCFRCHLPLPVRVPGGGYHYECAKLLGLVP
jgi:hypothetical protein